MSRIVQIKLGDELVEGEELDFKAVTECWNEYVCEDGSRVRARLVASRVIRLNNKQAPDGQPLYVLGSTTVIAAMAPTETDQTKT